jgi:ATP-dependent helicase/DNAse subunit B
VKFREKPKKLSHNELSDLLRASIVLSVSAMDAYFTNKFVDILIPYLKNKGPNKRLAKLLEDAGLDVEQALEMINMERPWRRIRTLMDAYLEKFTTQKAHIIDELFLALGIKDFTKHAQGIVKYRGLLSKIEHIVERRHEIVHDGDLNSYGKMRRISAREVAGYTNDIAAFIGGSERLCSKFISRLTTG